MAAPGRSRNGPSPRAWGLLEPEEQEWWASGPSPRAWGLLNVLGRPQYQPRSIPTCVGTTDALTSTRMRARSIPTCVGTTGSLRHQGSGRPVHPHVRGDYPPVRLEHQKATGPSPRAWGLLEDAPIRYHAERSIPTCVGTTTLHSVPEEEGAVHPHVRGDYYIPVSVNLEDAGPSPRAWGLRFLAQGIGTPLRSIPTCVGTTHDPDDKNGR